MVKLMSGKKSEAATWLSVISVVHVSGIVCDRMHGFPLEVPEKIRDMEHMR